MLKETILLGILTTSLLAVSLNVKKDDVVLSLNTQEVSLAKETTQNIEEGTTICYVSGKGKAVIPELKRQLKKNKLLQVAY